MFKNFLTKKLLQSQLKNVPEDQKEMFMKLIEENPDLFMQIGKETQEKIKQGKDQMTAAMEVMKEHEAELKQIMAK